MDYKKIVHAIVAVTESRNKFFDLKRIYTAHL